MEEPSVLDYLKSILKFWQRGEKIELPPLKTTPEATESASQPPPAISHQPSAFRLQPSAFPWRSLLALALALGGQSACEPSRRSLVVGIMLYMLSFALLLWAYWRKEWTLPSIAESLNRSDPFTVRRIPLIIAMPLVLAAFLAFGGNLFTTTNLLLWLLAILFFVWALWRKDGTAAPLWTRVRAFFAQESWQIVVTRWTLLLLAALSLVVFFRLYRLDEVPAEPFSDHAEKILDVYDITQGQTHIFFPRNTGREGFQMYLTVAVASIFGTGLSFLSLKIGTALVGLGILPYMYLLGREAGSRRVGLLALLSAGIAYWPNVISRAGLRFPLYPLFVAPTLYYLIRGLRTQNRNDFILSGLFLGLGLHGYSTFRIVPLVVVIAFGLYLLHSISKGRRVQAIVWLSILALTSLLVFLPLLRYALENPEGFSYRVLSRLGSVEQPLPDVWYKVFFSNLWNALEMFHWDDGQIWVNSVTHRPALDVVSGALFLLGVMLVLVRYIRQRHWLDLFLLLSIPLLQLPSILSLAYPDENPALNRAAGAMVPVFLIVALALDGLLAGLGAGKNGSTSLTASRAVLVWAVMGILLLWSASQNYDLVFRQYDRQFRMGAWNSSEMGAVIKQFGQTYGTTDTVWIVPYPHWVDTRLPGVWAGIPNRDFAMWRESLTETLSLPGAKLFIVKADADQPEYNDQATLDVLAQLYPQGTLSLYPSKTENHEFWIYFVP